MKQFLLFVGLLLSLAAAAQKPGTVKGSLLDGTATSGRHPLDEATVTVMESKDSSLVSFALTSNSGYFEIKGLAPGDYYLLVTYQGFATLKKSFSVTAEKPVADLGDVSMTTAYKTLDNVVVTDVAPIKVKGDTVEYNAGSFKTKPNANVEDLLKKLPGVQVERDGTVKAQGENVQKVYVDGKEFFGNDPKLATKNLSADMVESVQVYDDMSDQAKFSKIDDGSRAKALNIKLKKDKKNGLFGRAMAAYGTNDRYDATLSLNRFKGNTQVSVIGAANNVNKQGFSFNDVIGAMGGFGGMMRGGGEGGGGMMGGMGGGQMMMGSRTGGGSGSAVPGMSSNSGGIARSLSGGVNYRDVWSPKLDVTSSLFYSNTRTNTMRQVRNQSLFNLAGYDSTAITNSRNNGVRDNENLRFNMRLEWRIDSMNSLLYTPAITLQHSDSYSEDTALTTAISGTKPEALALSSRNINESVRDGHSINQNLLWRHRFGRAGRTLTVGWTNTLNNSDGSGSVYAPTTYYKGSGSGFSIVQDQQAQQKTRAHNNLLSASYTEPIGRNKILEFNYAYTHNYSESDRKTMLYNPSTKQHDIVSRPQTNYFENTYTAHRAGANFRLQQRKYNFQVGMGAQVGELATHSIKAMGNKDTSVTLNYVNLFPTANFQYSFSRSKNLRVTYRGRTNQPSIAQLQDAPDFSNPLQVTTGNPGLGQEFVNTFNANFNTFQFLTFKYYAINLNVTQTSNKIVNAVDSLKLNPNDSIPRQLLRPENVQGAYTASLFFAYGAPIKALKGLNVTANTMGLYNRDVSLLYKVRSFNHTLVLTQTLGLNYNYKEKLDLGISGSLAYNKVTYGSQPSLNNDYLTQTYSADITWTLPKNFLIATDFDYFVNTGRAEGFNQKIPMWNASVGKQFLKGKQAEIRFSVNDLLNQNQSITRNTGINYVEDVQTNVLRRFFTVSLTYNLNRMAGKNMFSMPRQLERGTRNMRIGM
ncbi:TonB-dependent receptor [Flaviaesturariibacter amylovorans]|uniref:TonB-dependent receptor n=1 Tax=Flaviaesturariibacter amylovorans TaxID=1084520 RepID=A0ABP8HGJ4_9BACT